jgi:hypothetical protein
MLADAVALVCLLCLQPARPVLPGTIAEVECTDLSVSMCGGTRVALCCVLPPTGIKPVMRNAERTPADVYHSFAQ